MIIINAVTVDDIELLPDVVDTVIFKNFEQKNTKLNRFYFNLYNAISKRENYYQFNSPTAFGNPDYSMLCGIVSGLLLGNELVEKETNGYIQIFHENSTKIILSVQKIKKTQSYIKERNELNSFMKYIM